jgi:Rod binding domain-containing protein
MDGVEAAGTGAFASTRTLELRRGELSPEAFARLGKVAHGFDALFAGTLVSELMKPLQGAGFAGSGPGASVLQGMLETQLSDHLAKGSGLGVGRLVAGQLRTFMAAAAEAKP